MKYTTSFADADELNRWLVYGNMFLWIVTHLGESKPILTLSAQG